MKGPSGLPDKSPPDANSLAETRAQELSDLITHFTFQQSLNDFSVWLKEFQLLKDDFPENKDVQYLYAKTLKNAVKMFGERVFFADMLFLLDELELHYQKTRSEEVAEFLAEAITQTIFYLRGSWDVEGTSKLLNRLRNLVKAYPLNETLLIFFAKSYNNAINRFCSDRHNFICDRFLFELRMFANKHQDNLKVQIEFANSLLSIIGTLAREKRFPDLYQVLDELKRLANRYPKNEKLALIVSRANILASLATSYKEERKKRKNF